MYILPIERKFIQLDEVNMCQGLQELHRLPKPRNDGSRFSLLTRSLDLFCWYTVLILYISKLERWVSAIIKALLC